MFRLIALIGLYLCSTGVWADGIPQFFPSVMPASTLDVQDQSTQLDLNDFSLIEIKQRYIGEDQPIHEDTIMKNDFFQDETIRIYNNTQYSFDDIKNKYARAQANQVTFEDLSISLGYGMEFMLSEQQSVGYEYISSFPHDRGQSIRLFWKITF